MLCARSHVELGRFAPMPEKEDRELREVVTGAHSLPGRFDMSAPPRTDRLDMTSP